MLRNNTNKSLPRWLLGMVVTSIFTLAYLLVPIYLLSAIAALVFLYPTTKSSLMYALPMLASTFVRPRASPLAMRLISPMLDYFDYEAIYLDETVRSSGKNYIFVAQPHGVLSFVGMCSAASKPMDILRVPTAAASVVLRMPILKNLMGIFNLIDASAVSLRAHLRGGGSVLIYVGGIAELFKTCRNEERLYLTNRKGFIKLALTEGVDVVPAYLFGNSSVLSVLKHGPLASLSRKMQASLTIFWGKFLLPIPRDEKVTVIIIYTFFSLDQ
jgi:hypothetical protein